MMQRIKTIGIELIFTIEENDKINNCHSTRFHECLF